MIRKKIGFKLLLSLTCFLALAGFFYEGILKDFSTIRNQTKGEASKVSSKKETVIQTAKPKIKGTPGKDFVAGQLIVKLKNSNDLNKLKQASKGLQIIAIKNSPDSYLVKFKAQDINKVLKEIKTTTETAYIAPNYIRKASYVPNDPSYYSQWALQKMQLSQGWNITKGSSNVKIAIVDTGVDLDHPDLAPSLVEGMDFVNPGTTPEDEAGHGTHVAGIAAAVMDNSVGIAGVAGGAKIMPVRVLDKDGFGNDINISAGIRWAADNGANIINLSLGGAAPNPLIEEAVNYAYKKGVVVIAAAGNESMEVGYPAAYPNAIAVGATNQYDSRASFSNFGPELDVVAPGVQIYSTLPNSTVDPSLPLNYGNLDGTSMASPQVAGLAALILSKYPNLNPYQLEVRLKLTSDDINLTGFDNYTGYGRVNAYKALSVSDAYLPTDLNENNNSKGLAKIAELDKTVTGNIGAAGDEDWFKFAVPVKKVSVNLQVPENMDGKVEVYNEAGELIQSINDGAVGVSESAVLTIGTSGNYYFKVIDNNGLLITSPYQLNVGTMDEYEPNDLLETASLLNLGDKIYSKIGTAGDIDHYKIIVPETGQLNIKLYPPSRMDGELYLLDSSGNTLQYSDDFEEGVKESIIKEVPPGTYYIRVNDYYGDPQTESYSLEVLFNQAPAVISTEPAANSTNAAVDKGVVVNFNEPILASYNYSNIQLVDQENRSVPAIKSIVGDKLIISPINNLADGVGFRLTIPANSLSDLQGYAFKQDFKLDFQTQSNGSAPILRGSSPMNGSTDIRVSDNIEITFSKNIYSSANYDGIVVLDENNQEIAASKTILGTKLIIDPESDLANNKTYTVKVPADAVKEVTGTSFAEEFTCSFTTSKMNGLLKLAFKPDDVVQDPVKPVLYMTSKAEKKLYVINTETGGMKTLTFDQMPERLELGRGQFTKELYVTLLTKEHDYYWDPAQQTGAIAVIDLDTFTLKDKLELNMDPFDVSADSNGRLFISSGSGQSGKIMAFDRVSKTVISTTSAYLRAYLALYQTEDRLYTISSAVSPMDHVVYLMDNGVFRSNYDSPYHGDYPLSTKFTLEKFNYLINGSGVIFNVNPDRSQDMTFFKKLNKGFTDITFETDGSKFYTIPTNTKAIYSYNAQDFTSLDTFYLAGKGKFVFKTKDKLLAVIEPDTAVTGYQTGIQTVNPEGKYTFDKLAVKQTKVTNSVITVTFNKNISQGENFNTIVVTDKTGVPLNVDRAIAGNELRITVNPALDKEGNVTFTLPMGAVIDEDGNKYGEVYSFAYSPKFAVNNNLIKLPMTVADSVVDPELPKVYFTSPGEKRLYSVNYQTGEAEFIIFDKTPESLALGKGANAKQLYIALLHRSHSPYWFDDTQTGTVAAVDLSTFASTQSMELAIDPYDLAATADGHIFITSGSGQWSKMDSYNLKSKQIASSFSGIRQGSKLMLDPNTNKIYLVCEENSDLRVLNYNQGLFTDAYSGGTRILGYSFKNPQMISSNGKLLFNGSGNIFNIEQDKSVVYYKRLDAPFNDILYNNDASKFFTLPTTKTSLNVYDGNNFGLINEVPLAGKGKFLQLQKDNLITVVEALAPTNDFKYGIQVLGTDSGYNQVPLKINYVKQSAGKVISVNFSASILQGDKFNEIKLTDANNQSVEMIKEISNNQLILKPVQTLSDGTYNLAIPQRALKDTGGNVLTKDYTESFLTKVNSSSLIKLPFKADKAAMDPSAAVVYVINKVQKRVYAIDTVTGVVSFATFAKTPENLKWGKGAYANQLFVLLRQQDSAGNYQLGSIAIIDQDLNLKDWLDLDLDGVNLAVSRDGYVYVVATGTTDVSLDSYNLTTKQKSQRTSIYRAPYLEMHPTLNRLYAVDENISPRDINAYPVDGGQFIGRGYDSPYHGTYSLSTAFAIDPTGKYLFNASGNIFSIAETTTDDLKFVNKIGAFTDIAFDQDLQNIYYFPTGQGQINKLDGQNYSVKETLPLGGLGKFLFRNSAGLVAVVDPFTATSTYQSGIQVLYLGNGQLNANFKLNNEANTTNSSQVTINFDSNLAGAEGVAYVRMSNDGANWSSWQDYNPTANWQLANIEGKQTVYVQVMDKFGKQSGILTDDIILDTKSPVTNLAIPSLAGNMVKTPTFRVSWNGLDSSAVANYDVQYRIGGSAAWLSWLTGTTLKYGDFKGVPGNVYYFRIRAKDNAGNQSPWTTALYKAVAPSDNNSLIYGTPKGFLNGAMSLAYLGTTKYSTTAYSEITYRFTGNKVSLLVTKGPGRSQAKIYIDGVYKGNIDTLTPTTYYMQPSFIMNWSTAGTHSIKIVNIGTRGRSRLDIDGLAIER